MAKKQTAVRKPAKAARTPTVKVLRQEIAADVAKEAALTRKHEVGQARAVAKKVTSLKHELAARTKKTGLALAPGDVNCCAAQALAASLRLALGVRVHEEDVLGLYWRTAADPDEGATILDTLRAAREYGLGGARPVLFARRDFDLVDALTCGNVIRDSRNSRSAARPAGLLVAAELPEGPHAVTVAPDGTWWSWGEPYSPADFPGAVIDQAWAVTWS